MISRAATIAGWYGVLALLGAYALVSFQILNSGALLYQLLNLTGAVGIVWDAVARRDVPPAVLNLAWAGIALVTIIRLVV